MFVEVLIHLESELHTSGMIAPSEFGLSASPVVDSIDCAQYHQQTAAASNVHRGRRMLFVDY
jgi:hypothetical protein